MFRNRLRSSTGHGIGPGMHTRQIPKARLEPTRIVVHLHALIILIEIHTALGIAALVSPSTVGRIHTVLGLLRHGLSVSLCES